MTREAEPNAPAARVDADKRADAYFAGMARRRREVGFDQTTFTKVAVTRILDASGPSLLALHDAIAASGGLSGEGWSASPLDLGVRFAHAFLVEGGGRPFAVGVSTEPPTRSSPTFRAMVATEIAQRDDVGGSSALDDLSREVFAEIRVEERCEEEGWPDDFADAARGRVVRTFAAIGAFGDPGPAAAVAAAREIAGGKWSAKRIFDARPSSNYGETREDWSTNDPGISTPCDWMEAFGRLRAPLAAAGLLEEVAAASAAVAERSYAAYYDPDDEIERALEEAAQAVAAMDGGLPGAGAAAFVRSFEGRTAALRIAPAARLAAGLRALAPGTEVENGDGAVSLSPVGAREVLRLTRYDETYEVAFEADGDAWILEPSRKGASHRLGRYRIDAGGSASWLEPPPYRTRALRDLSAIDTLVGSALCLDLATGKGLDRART